MMKYIYFENKPNPCFVISGDYSQWLDDDGGGGDGSSFQLSDVYSV